MRAGQRRLVQKRFAPTSSTGAPQAGQTAGFCTGTLPSVWATAPRISGMTSLERRTSTREPTFTSLRVRSPKLFRVARRTVAPASSTGAMKASGVSLPVLPTCQTTFSTVVSASSASNL